ncbi:MAG: hypothetical protein QOI98_1940 [Solirubrobacteraceae bacterium]|nr:hypothetical protein [Solirubrobacteraceae bacterium]
MAGRGGHGRVWASVLPGLAERVRLDVRDRDAAARGRRPDVWLADGHQALPALGPEPLVVQVHEAIWRDPELAGMLDPAFAEVLERNVSAAVRAAAVVITAAESARRDLVAAYELDPARVEVVPHGVDLERFRPGLDGGPEIVAEAGAAQGAPYVVFVGVLHPRKNLSAVRAAIGALAQAGFPHVLAVVGAPAGDRADPSALEEEAVAEIPDAPGRIARLRAVSDEELAQVLAGAAAFCLPSLYEGFGLPCLEAMACGAPVVVSDRGALPELVGDAGLVVSPDADAVRDALARVVSEPALADDLRVRARARAETFPWSRTVDGWLAALERAASGDSDMREATLPE